MLGLTRLLAGPSVLSARLGLNWTYERVEVDEAVAATVPART